MRTLTGILVLCMVMAFVGCNNNKGGKALTPTNSDVTDENLTPDTTIYGVCGEGSAMHTVELIDDDGRVRTFIINPDDSIPVVFGGLLAGDRLAVLYDVVYGDTMATRVINLTTLLGEWVSIDKNFDIQEGGVVTSHVEAETNPWTSWKICNGMLVLNKDTFEILELGADSLYMENKEGVFAYKRKKK